MTNAEWEAGTRTKALTRMRVCMVVHQYFHRDSRVQRYAKALAEQGASVHVLALRDPASNPAGGTPGVEVYSIRLARGYSGVGRYIAEYFAASILFAMLLSWMHIKNRYHVIHVHNMPDSLVFATLLPRLMGAKVILDIHDTMPEVYMAKFGKSASSPVIRLLRLQERLAALLAHAVITANRSFKQKLVSRGIPAAKVTVVHNAPDPELFIQPNQESGVRDTPGRFRLIYPGTIAPRYGLDVAIRALPELIREIPELRLRIIGPHNGHVTDLCALASRLHVDDHVCFKPAIPAWDVPREIREADVGIYPALPSEFMNIALPTKVLEYVAMRRPVIASKLDVLADIFPESAMMYFEPGNAKEFARGVLELYENPARCEEQVRFAADVCAARLSWSRERQEYLTLISRI